MSTLVSALPQAGGGKAGTLRELESAGFRVPAFVVSPPNIAEVVDQLGLPLAVRSSATIEDGHRFSFAGQFRSYLNLHSVDEVADSIHMCRESATAPSVVDYCRKNSIDPGSLHMEIIVQRMVQPQLAGVAFSVNPVTGAEEVVIEACEGLAGELLAGRKPALPPDHPLVRKFGPQIASVARKIQRHFGAPQDIEFAVENEILYILQSRPITRIGAAPDIGEWTNANFRDGGVSAGVCTPLMWSLYDLVWEETLKGFLGEIRLLNGDFRAGRMFFGRPYWNVGAVKRCLARMPGFVEREFDDDLGIRIDYRGNGIRTPMNLIGLIRAIPTAFAIRSFFAGQGMISRDLLAGGFDAIERKYEPMRDDVDSAFHQLVERDYVRTESNYFRTVFAVSLAKLDFKRSFPATDLSPLVAGLPEMRHMAPIRELRAMAARGERDVAMLLRKFRHHSQDGLDIRAPRWDEDAEWLEELTRRLPRPLGKDPRRVYDRARAAEFCRLPGRTHKRFSRKLDRLRDFVWLREEMRDLSSRMYYLIRRYVLEIAKRRGIGSDIFFMTFREILEDDRSNIERRRETYESYRNFKAPNEIGMHGRFDGVPARAELRGVAASQGTASGIAHVARTLGEALDVEERSILVCQFIDPGWTLALGRVTGVVTETGGLLSHAAVLCREYGIPAVLGVPGATERIRDGRTVVVHGSAGYV